MIAAIAHKNFWHERRGWLKMGHSPQAIPGTWRPRNRCHELSYFPPAPEPEPEPAPPLDPLEPLDPDVPLEPDVPEPVPLLGDPRPLPGVLLGELMSGVPGVGGSPGVEGLPSPDPLPLLPLVPELLPGAPVAVTPKCELICWLHDESMEGQLDALNVGALCSFV
jgi:hypothetical protein